MNTTIERTKESMIEEMKKLNKENGLNPSEKKLAITLFKNAQKIGTDVFLEIPLTSLKIDHEMYQRPTQKHVRTIAKNWNFSKCDPLIVNYRNDGFFYVIDGQHRTEAALMRGIESLVCRVFVGLSVKEEADLFTEQNEGTKKLTPFDTFKANICRGEITDTQIKEVCDAHGIKVEKSNSIKTLKSVTTARQIIQRHGKENFEWVISFLEDAGWNAYKDTYKDGFLASVNNVKNSYSNDITYVREKLINIFRTSSPKEVQAVANAEHPYMGRTTSLFLLMEDLIKETNPEINFRNRVERIAMA